MIALAIICLLLAAALVVGIVITGTSQQVVLDSAVGTFSTQPVWIFVAGVVATLLALLGLSFLGRGTRRRVARRREMKRLRRVEEEQSESRETQRQETARADAARERSARPGYDEPDRHLVRGTAPVGYDPDAGEHLADGRGSTATSPPSADTTGLDEPARHPRA
jgi:hypothetical protein